MDTPVPPVPKPRTGPNLDHVVAKEANKKPVPLPRLKILTDDACVDSNMTVPERDTHELKDSIDGEEQDKKTTTRSLKDEFKSASESVQGKGKLVIESTKNVSARLEKSVRNMIGKRRTVQPQLTVKENFAVSEPKVIRSQSLPSGDIFQSISFNSPLNIQTGIVEYQSENDDDMYGAPPPVYPPPPLPDESMYDEVQSVISGCSSSNYDSYCCSSVAGSGSTREGSIYEEVTLIRGHQTPSISFFQKSDSETSPPSSVNIKEHSSKDNTSVLRSDSWSFYDSTPKENIYMNVAELNDSAAGLLPSNLNKETNNRCASRSSMSPSVLSDLEALRCTSSDDEYFDTTSSHFSVKNELYDRWEPCFTNLPDAAPRSQVVKSRNQPSKSVIYEFDPLYQNTARPDSGRTENSSCTSSSQAEVNCLFNELTSPYGKINRLATTSISESSEGGDLESSIPPIPPKRFDSVTLMTASDNPSTQPQSTPRNILAQEAPAEVSVPICGASVATSSSCTATTPPELPARATPEELTSKPRLSRWSSMKRAIQFVTDNSSWSPVVMRRSGKPLSESLPKPLEGTVFYESDIPDTSIVIDRPALSPKCAVQYSGPLYKIAAGSDKQRELVKRWCVLAESKLLCYLDRSGMCIKDVIPLDTVFSIHVVLDQRLSSDGEDVYCFEVNVAWKGRCYLFGAASSTERRVWMQKILESLTSVFPLRISSDYTRAGWCFMKEGISGVWSSAWIMLHKRTLFYCSSGGKLQEADLRKARCIVLQDATDQAGCPRVSEKGPLVLVDFPGMALYLQVDLARETVAWRHNIRAAAIDNGPNLSQQQLTKDDIPAIVDKCINFVYAHGSMSEGIYRRSGTNSVVTRLLTQFRKDAFSVQLTRQEYSEYDVSSVLKRFFRDLPEALLTTELHGQLCDIASGKFGKTEESRLVQYRRALEQLPPINFLTTRKLISHLHFIHEQQEKNLMPMENLAAIWGPSLLHIEGGDSLTWSKLESAVVADLILFYPRLFEVDAEELTREKRMQEVLERYHAGNNSTQNKPSGDLKVWIHLASKESGNCVNVTVGPQRQAGEVCTELASRMSFPDHELCLEEHVCGGALVRPLHHTERVLDAVLRWSYWDDVDRRDNCLVLRENTVYKEASSHAKHLAPVTKEFRFADPKTKSFKSFMFEFSQAKLCYYKDKNGSIKLNEWKIEDIIWYLGHEPKRNPQMRWAITFLDKHKKNKRSKESPYFGYTVAGTSKDDQLQLIGAMLVGEYPQGLMPSPVLLV